MEFRFACGEVYSYLPDGRRVNNDFSEDFAGHLYAVLKQYRKKRPDPDPELEEAERKKRRSRPQSTEVSD